MAGPEDWQRVRRAYEAGKEPVRAIAARHRLTPGQIYARAKREAWQSRTAGQKPAGTAKLLRRLKNLVDRELNGLEQRGEGTSDAKPDAAALDRLAGTLAKIVEIERKEHRSGQAAVGLERRVIDDARRDALAQRLEALHGKHTAQTDPEGA